MGNQLNVSYQAKYAEGIGESRNFFENYFDINYFSDSGLYLFSQLEYSSPPLLGESFKDVSDALNIFYLQFTSEKSKITLGDLYLLYGRGLSMHTYQDQNIDFDNSLCGLEYLYNVSDNYDLSIAVGSNKFNSRLNPADLLPSLSIENKLMAINNELYFDNMNLHYLGMIYEQSYDYSDIFSLTRLESTLGHYLKEREDFILSEMPSEKMKNLEHNFGLDFYFLQIDFYFEKSIIYYDKILGERTKGHKDYFSSYFNIFDFNIFYEYKNYNAPYLFSVFSTPPIGFREASSVLISRNLHSPDFNNEYGHQLEISKSFFNSSNFLFSYALALRHDENHERVRISETFFDFLDEDKFLSFSEHYPFRQIYLEYNGWGRKDKMYYKVGYDNYYEITNLKTIFAETIPIQLSYNLKNANSLSIYIEMQKKIEKHIDPNIEYDYFYFSPSFNYGGKWLITAFADIENQEDPWYGIDYTYNFKNASQLSIFYGSQRGGLVCANGSCVMQPDFEDGFKLTYLVSM